MSARILYSLTDDKAGGGGGGAHKPIGCMNGIFQLFDRGHFLPGDRRLAGISHKRLTAGQNEKYGAEEDAMSVKSMGKVSKAAAAKERHRLSADSLRSSASSSCNSSGFSSIEDHKPAKMEPVNSTENRAKDLPRLQQSRKSKDSGENTLPKSLAMTHVDSPRPVLPSKVARERNSTASESLKDLWSLSRPRDFVDSPRFSYDGRESRDEIKSRAMKLKEQPRHSVDSKRSSLSSLSLKVQQPQEDAGSHKWQSSVVAKLMGLEPASSNTQASSKPQTGHGRNSPVDALDPFSISSRTPNNYKHELNADLVVRLKPNVAHVLDKVSVTSKESPLQSPTLSVYGELEKRFEKIEFKRSGKDLRALKQILEVMQRSEQPEDDRKNINRVITKRSNIGDSAFVAKFAHRSNTKSAGPMTSHEVWSPICLDNLKGPLTKATNGFDREQIPRSRNGIQGLPKIQVSMKIRRNSSDQQTTCDLTPRTSPRQAHYTSRSGIPTLRAEDCKQNAEGNIPGRNFGDSSPRPLRKKLEPIYSRNRSNHPGRQPKESQSPRRVPKSKVCIDLSGGNSRKLTERSNRISTNSDNEDSLASQDEDTEVTSLYGAKSEQTVKKVLSGSKVDEEPPSEFGTTLAEQPSPVSVLDSSYFVDESPSPSPMQMTSEAFRGDKVPTFHGKGRGLHASGDLFPNEKHCKAPNKPQTESTHSEHTYILQTLSPSGLLGNPDASNLMMIQLHPSGTVMTNLFTTLGHDKLSDNLLPSEDLSGGCLDQSQSKRGDRIQRKLLFDVIDEILVQKLTSDNHGNRFLPGSLAAKKTGREQLLKALRSEIAHLQVDNSKCNINNDKNEDVVQTILRRDLECESQSWKGCYDDSSIVLDIERLIFKDLVTEVVTSDAAGLRNSLTSYSRQMALK